MVDLKCLYNLLRDNLFAMWNQLCKQLIYCLENQQPAEASCKDCASVRPCNLFLISQYLGILNCAFLTCGARDYILLIYFALSLSVSIQWICYKVQLTHSFLTAKQLFPRIFTFFYAISKFSRPEHDCYAKFTSCSKWRNIKTTLWRIKNQLK